MSDSIVTGSETVPTIAVETKTSLLAGSKARKVREAILAYLFIIPAFLIVFTFGIFPLAFSGYQSLLRGLNNIVGPYNGFGNYVRAIGDLAYSLGFWMAVGAVIYGLYIGWKAYQQARLHDEQPWLLLIPAAALSVGMALFTRFFFTFLPQVLLIANEIRAAKQQGAPESTSQLFQQFLVERFTQPEIQRLFWIAMVALLISAAIYLVVSRNIPHSDRNGSYFGSFLATSILLIAGAALLQFILVSIQEAYTAALEGGETLRIWTHIVTISAGLLLWALSWIVWRSANNRDSNLSMFARLAAAALLLVGGYVLAVELPLAGANGDKKWFMGLLNTLYYSAGSIPFQLGISLVLATFLFQNIRGKGFFRMIYFLPYITPVVGAAAVFRVLFSGRVDAPINQLWRALGFSTQRWLDEPAGVFQLMLGNAVDLPSWAVGPSLSLVVIIIFGIWTFVGFNTVIFLAGLGGIPNELYEAAAIDGAGRWTQFRHVTLPLLSPTIYFTTLYAVIGTFKSFTHIYVLRSAAALGSSDTASVVIFDAMKRDTRYGYAAALSILLLIIVMGLTVINNRVASRRVFYG